MKHPPCNVDLEVFGTIADPLDGKITCEWCAERKEHYLTTGLSEERICRECAEAVGEGYDINEL
jgi:hypothetical protein